MASTKLWKRNLEKLFNALSAQSRAVKLTAKNQALVHGAELDFGEEEVKRRRVNNRGVGKLHHCLNMWFCDRQLEDSALKMSLELDWPCCDTLLQPICRGTYEGICRRCSRINFGTSIVPLTVTAY